MTNKFSRHILTLALAFGIPAGLSAQTELLTAPDSVRLSPYETAVKALGRGDYNSVESYLSGLGKKEKGTFAHKMLLAELLLSKFDTEGASEVLKGISTKRIAEPELFERVRTLLQREERMLQSALPITLVGERMTGTRDEILGEITKMAAPSGALSEKSFTPAGGSVRWVVRPGADGGETFGIVYRLGDGTWDEAHWEAVTVLGLDPKGKFAYPFLLSDGETLYFAYSGPETLGGWDIYLSRYNPAEHTLLVPQQLPIPVNSPSDDPVYIYDEVSEIGAFVTERNAPEGMATLIKYRRAEGGAFPTDKDSVASYAFFLTAGRDADTSLFQNASTSKPEAREPLFWIKDQAVYSADDLRNPASRSILERYVAVSESFSSEETRLEKLRAEYAKSGASRGTVSSEILAIEKELKSRQKELQALRNEVIKSETGDSW